MQGIYNYVPETDTVSRVYSVAADLYLQFLLRALLFPMLNTVCTMHFHISTFRSMCAVPNVAVFCNSLISCFPVCCSGIVSLILRWFDLPLLSLVSLLLSHSTHYYYYYYYYHHHHHHLLYAGYLYIYS